MIYIPDEIKPILNTLLRYHRKNASILAKNFILDENYIEMCDLSTLSRIESNKTKAHDDLYFFFFKKFNQSIQYDTKVNTILEDSNKNLLSNAETNNVSKIKTILLKLIEVLQPFKDCAIYHEYIELYQLIYTYYNTQEFNKKQLDKYISLYEIIPELLRPIFISIAYHYYSRVNIEEFLSIELLKKSFDLTCDSIIKIYLLDAYHVRNNDKMKIIEFSKKGIRLCKLQNNNYYLSKFYNLLAYAYRFDNPKLAIEYLTMSIVYFNEKTDPYSTLSAYYHNLAYLAYDRKDYVSILRIYKNHLYNDINFLKAFYYLLIKCIEETSKDEQKIKHIIAQVKLHSKTATDAYKSILSLYESIYYKFNKAKIEASIKYVSTLFNLLQNEPLLRKLLTEIVHKYCIQTNSLNIYTEFKNNFQ